MPTPGQVETFLLVGYGIQEDQQMEFFIEAIRTVPSRTTPSMAQMESFSTELI
jgi:hypothetical protein